MYSGKGSQFRRRSAIERLASQAGQMVPEAMREALRGSYERTLATLRPGRMVCTLPGGERVRLLPSLRQVTWNRDEYDAFRRDVHSGDVVFDVGANLLQLAQRLATPLVLEYGVGEFQGVLDTV